MDAASGVSERGGGRGGTHWWLDLAVEPLSSTGHPRASPGTLGGQGRMEKSASLTVPLWLGFHLLPDTSQPAKRRLIGKKK